MLFLETDNVIEVGRGRVPHVAAGRGLCRWGRQRFSAGACGKCYNTFEISYEWFRKATRSEHKSIAGALLPRVPIKQDFRKQKK